MQAEQAHRLSPLASGGRPGRSRLRLPALLVLTALVAACALPTRPSPAPSPSRAPEPAPSTNVSVETPPTPARVRDVAPAPAPAAAAPVAPPAPGQPAAAPPSPVLIALEQAERLRGIGAAELSAEITRLAATPATPLNQLLLALALKQGQQPADSPRVQTLLQAVLANDSVEARGLRALARLLLVQHAQQQRLEEQLERQAQQLRESQRRSDQLSERLEALRALERSMPSRPVR
ncbi:hypothetical protein JI739_20860 [Ramlibacter sp. AW1]|uniref:Uncharacterized protein n=1 Tax=Ramlibacter aurantiacus TaxID=2801330 RepID=A0A936ZK36_9BURK|nr:hypothetical protein [Ramlibacter aurantiacus]MBL0422799.1 hypothetical protein [Ramlibacter aurantiacus]